LLIVKASKQKFTVGELDNKLIDRVRGGKRRTRRRSRLNKAYSIEMNRVWIKILYIVETVVKMNRNYTH
jgi:hypothetical protein